MCASKTDLELYIHIPFCIKKCNYCDFLSFPSNEERREIYVQSLINEIEQTGKLLDKDAYAVRSIFIGGGTPSLLSGKQIERIMPVSYTHLDVYKRQEYALLKAIFLGDKTDLSKEQKHLYEENGMAHLLACLLYTSTYFRWSCSTLSASGVLYRKGYWYRYFKRTSFLGTVLSEFFSTHFCGQFSTSFT